MEKKNNILTNNDIMNLCLDFYKIGRSNQPFFNAKHLRDAIENSIKSYIEFRKKKIKEVKNDNAIANKN